jgi:predicted transcriptional regulator
VRLVTRLTVEVDPRLAEAVARVAERTGEPKRFVIERALATYLKLRHPGVHVPKELVDPDLDATKQ